MLKRAWNSPTLMTWMSYSTKALTLFGVLPLILNKFSPGDIVLWYLFSTIISLQSIADFGFRQTFSRIISFAFGGAKDIGVFSNAESESTSVQVEPNERLLNSIISTMKYIYKWLSGVVFLALGVLGSWSLIKPINDSSDITHSWWAWLVVLIVSCIGFYGKIYMNFLEGINKIALVRRVETFTSIGSILSSIAVLFLAPSLLNLVVVNQIWVVVATLRDYYLCMSSENGFFQKVSKPEPFDLRLFSKIWKPAWRSGISGFMSVGLTNLTGLIYAQVGTTSGVASYLLALRIINQVKEISMAPFYSKLPLLAILRVKNQLTELNQVVRRGMFFSHLVFLMGFIIIGLFSDTMLRFINSEVAFVSQEMWILLGFAFFVHRFGAMHIQVYMSTNHIISHIADGVSGVLYICSSLVLSRYIGVYSIPIGMIVGYLGFYSWYAAVYSYRSLNVGFWNFEKKVSFIPVIFLALYIAFVLVKEKNV